jgi:hypothetical protein
VCLPFQHQSKTTIWREGACLSSAALCAALRTPTQKSNPQATARARSRVNSVTCFLITISRSAAPEWTRTPGGALAPRTRVARGEASPRPRGTPPAWAFVSPGVTLFVLRSRGRFWLMPQRLVWRPSLGGIKQFPLDSIRTIGFVHPALLRSTLRVAEFTAQRHVRALCCAPSDFRLLFSPVLLPG